MIRVPTGCIAWLRRHRTHYGPDLVEEYSAELSETYEQIRPFLPPRAKRILDIGAGLGGINVLLSRQYDEFLEITLLDRSGITPGPQGGFHEGGFAAYNSFEHAIDLLGANGVEDEVLVCDIDREPFPDGEFDIVISLLSWGFHYPITTYRPRARLIVADVRRNTDGEEALSSYGKLTVVHEAEKYRRVVVEC